MCFGGRIERGSLERIGGGRKRRSPREDRDKDECRGKRKTTLGEQRSLPTPSSDIERAARSPLWYRGIGTNYA